VHCLYFTDGLLFCFGGDITHASPKQDFESLYTFDAYLLRAVDKLVNMVLKIKNTPLLSINCEYI